MRKKQQYKYTFTYKVWKRWRSYDNTSPDESYIVKFRQATSDMWEAERKAKELAKTASTVNYTFRVELMLIEEE